MSQKAASSPLAPDSSSSSHSVPTEELKSLIQDSHVAFERIKVDNNGNVAKSSQIVHIDSDDDFVNDEELLDPLRTRAIEEGAFRWYSMDRAINVLDSFSREIAPPTKKKIDNILKRKWMTLSRAQRRHYEEIAAYEFNAKSKSSK